MMKTVTFDAWARLLVLPLLLSPLPARGHDKWLEVEPFSSPTPVRPKVYLMTGEQLGQGEALPERRRARFVRFQIHDRAGKRDISSELREDQQPLSVLKEELPAGSYVLSLESAPVEIELAAAKFQSYLFEERLYDILVKRAAKGQEDAPGRERYSRSLKALVQVGGKLDKIATQPMGQELEIVPQQHPISVGRGEALTVQVLFRGKPLAGRAITCQNRFHGSVVARTVRTDERGRASFAAGRPGDYMLAMVHMEPSKEADMDWRSYWASLTFSLPPPKSAKAEDKSDKQR